MSPAEIRRAVVTRLTELGKVQREVSLFWTLEPSSDESGRVELTLKVAASLPAIAHGEVVEEPETELVDVNAMP